MSERIDHEEIDRPRLDQHLNDVAGLFSGGWPDVVEAAVVNTNLLGPCGIVGILWVHPGADVLLVAVFLQLFAPVEDSLSVVLGLLFGLFRWRLDLNETFGHAITLPYAGPSCVGVFLQRLFRGGHDLDIAGWT